MSADNADPSSMPKVEFNPRYQAHKSLLDSSLTKNIMGTNKEDIMSAAEKFIILPYRKNRGNLVAGEMRQASSIPSAEKIAASMASRFVGVAAYAVMVDEETGDMSSPRLLVKHGDIADLNAA